MGTEIHESDRLRLPEHICDPDPRTHLFVRLDLRTGQSRKMVVEDQYETIARFMLNKNVPAEIATHFETAKNLYLYAWFVYRFYPVAEQQVLACLEFSLRERFMDFVTAEKLRNPRGLEPGLKRLMEHAVKSGYVKNENFLAREKWARKRAERRYCSQISEEMRKAGFDSWEIDESKAVVTQEDLECDWLQIFLKTIPSIRNDYAHGSRTLKNNVCHSFELVSEIINQLYPSDSDTGSSNLK